MENRVLKSLEARDNGLTLLPEGEWGLLEKLDVMQNVIVALPATMNTWMRLRVLNAATNKLGELPEIGQCFALEEVTLTDNELGQLPESFANLTNLRVLHLGKNHLKNDALQF